METLHKLLRRRHSIHYRTRGSFKVLQEQLDSNKDNPESSETEKAHNLREGLKDGLDKLSSNIKLLDDVREN